MSDQDTNPAEPTENQGGGSTAAPTTTPDVTLDDPDAAVAAEPTENQGGGSD